MHNSIYKKFVIWTVLMLIPAIAACSVSYVVFRDHLTHAAEQQLQFLHKNEQALIQSTLRSTLTDVEVLSTTPLLQAMTDAHFLASQSKQAPQIFLADDTQTEIDLNTPQPLQGLSDQLLRQLQIRTPSIKSITIVGKLGATLGRSGITTWPEHKLDTQSLIPVNALPVYSHVWKTNNAGVFAGIIAPIINQSRRTVGHLRIEIAIGSILTALEGYDKLGDSTEAFLVYREEAQASKISALGLQAADDLINSLPQPYLSTLNTSPNLETTQLIRNENNQGASQ